MNLAINLSASDVDLGKASLPEVMAKCREFNGPTLFGFLAKLVHLLSSHTQDQRTRAWAEASLFDADIRARLARVRAGHPGTVLSFSRQQVLCAMKLTAMSSPQIGGATLSEPSQLHSVGWLLLQTTELMKEADSASMDVKLDLVDDRHPALALMMSRYLLENEEHFGAYFPRFYELITECLPAVFRKARLPADYLDVLFFEQFGVTLNNCLLFTMVVHFATANYTLEQLAVSPGMQIANLLAASAWDRDTQEALLSFFTTSYADLGLELLRHQSMPFEYDFEVFRDRPLLKDDSMIYVVDPHFLAGCIGDRLLRRLAQTLPMSRRQKLDGYVGEAFELYCAECIRSMPTHAHSVEPLTSSGKSVDFEIQTYRTRVFIEVCKANWRPSARYSGDPELVAIEMGRLQKELQQLAHAIADFIKSAPATTVEVIPLLVGMDRALGFYFMQATLDKVLRRRLKTALKNVSSPIAIRRLIVMSAEDFQSVCQLVVDGRNFKDLLDAVLVEDPDGLQNVSTVFTKRKYTVHLADPYQKSWQKARAQIEKLFPREGN